MKINSRLICRQRAPRTIRQTTGESAEKGAIKHAGMRRQEGQRVALFPPPCHPHDGHL
ncbi:hypothetical protein [Salmonella enterica]|uniref:hypothetical protein n=1 Tax=Salmonella enterica TaxID=28901 RepID=UPI00398C7A56